MPDKQRAFRCSDAVWGDIKDRAKASDISVNEYVIARLTGSDITGPSGEPAAVALVPVPSVNPVTVIDALAELEQRIAERAEALGKTPDAWVRGLVEYTLDRAVPTGVIPVVKGKTADNDERVSAILAESTRREAAHVANGGKPWVIPVSRFAHLQVAPKDSPNVKWKMHAEPGPPAWMTAPTTRPGMTRDEAVAVGQTHAMAQMSGKSA